MLNTIIQFIALVLLLLVTGIFWGPWFALHRSMKKLSKEEFIHIVKIMSANLAVPMRIMMPLCIVFIAASLFTYPIQNSTEFYLAFLSLCFIILSLIVTVSVEVPIVKKIEQWSSSTIPANIETIQNRWLKFHIIRTFLAIFSFTFYISSILFFHS